MRQWVPDEKWWRDPPAARRPWSRPLPGAGAHPPGVVESPDGEQIATQAQILDTGDGLPAEGESLTVHYDPENPYRSRPAGGGIRIYTGFSELLGIAFFLAASIFNAATMLAFNPREDLFLRWIR